eukprot:5128059-Pyramimonas_sp.AAC.2
MAADALRPSPLTFAAHLYRSPLPLTFGHRRVRATACGIKAMCKLGGGDMRRTLNILQVRPPLWAPHGQ